MPMTLLDRLPLPNFKVYLAGSVLLLSWRAHHAISLTSDPDWRLNASIQKHQALNTDESEEDLVHRILTMPPEQVNRNLTEWFVDVVDLMAREPLSVYVLINIAYCILAVLAMSISHQVFDYLREYETQRLKDKFWNFVFYKFIFVFGVANVQYMSEVLLWLFWFTLIAFLNFFGQLCKDRHEYLSSCPNTSRMAHARLVVLLGSIVAGASGLLWVAVKIGLPVGLDTFCFMLAECLLVLLPSIYLLLRYALELYETEPGGPIIYYTVLVFDCLQIVVELVHVVHMVVAHRLAVSIASLVLLLQLRHLLHALHQRRAAHASHQRANRHMDRSYPMASKEEVEKNQDNCAICWEPMKEARKLPCSHLFHNSCLCQWVQQDASCPTCRRALEGAAERGAADDVLPLPPRPRNHLFRFDGSRYVSWLPSFSVEVTRVRTNPAGIDIMARQVHSMFPQYPLPQLLAELAATGSAAVTVDNILAGRLLPVIPRAPTTEPPPDTLEYSPDTSLSTTPSPPTTATPSPAPSPDPSPLPSPARLTRNTLATLLENEPIDETGQGLSFPRNSQDRESTLERKKKMLLAAARRRYIQRHADDIISEPLDS